MNPPSNPTPVTPEEQGNLLKGHSYDGIQEYDNPLPLWWTVIFVVTCFFAFFYYVNITEFHFVNKYEDDLALQNAHIDELRLKDQQANLVNKLDEAALTMFTNSKDKQAQGKTTFDKFCVACHGAQGGGGIGPNLADAYWIHGGTRMDVFNTITKGVVEKGMAAWETSISSGDRASLVAYIYSMQGTSPSSPKEPQGDLFDPSKAPAPAATPAPAAASPAATTPAPAAATPAPAAATPAPAPNKQP
jgi:cytochrome c oxidase cbb3-type subunit 3